MKIKETVERDCCETRDLKKYRGEQTSDQRYINPQFCMHCGQLWHETSRSDAAGGTETVLKKVAV